MALKKGSIDKRIVFHFGKNISLGRRIKLREYILYKIKIYKFKLEYLSVVFCSDDYLLGINKEFLNHDYFTDIITFDLSDEKRVINAELYISVDRIKENAQMNHCSVKEEIHRVIFHGVLHLLGFKDKTDIEAKKMRVAEKSWLRDYFK
jgi:rRNA maturation RNase YbeY